MVPRAAEHTRAAADMPSTFKTVRRFMQIAIYAMFPVLSTKVLTARFTMSLTPMAAMMSTLLTFMAPALRHMTTAAGLAATITMMNTALIRPPIRILTIMVDMPVATITMMNTVLIHPPIRTRTILTKITAVGPAAPRLPAPSAAARLRQLMIPARIAGIPSGNEKAVKKRQNKEIRDSKKAGSRISPSPR